MSMELWWRAAALEALKALILSPLVTSSTPDSSRLQRRLAAILQPTLAVVLASPLLQVLRNPSHAIHSPPHDRHIARVLSPCS